MSRTHRYTVSFFTTTLFYLVLVGIYFYLQTQHLISDQKPQDKTIQLSLSTFVSEVVPPAEEPEEIEEKKPVVEEEIKAEPNEPEPRVQHVETPKPKVIHERTPVIINTHEKKILKNKVRKKASVKTIHGLKRTDTARNNTAKNDQFFAKIRQKINQHKSYPEIARKRRMQGKVKVEFTILATGNVGHISVSGPKVFHNSARYAVKSAFPVNTESVSFALPQSVNLTLHYQFK